MLETDIPFSELEEQRPGENKQTKINHSYINSGEYRKKFNTLFCSQSLQRLVYQLAKQMLLHRSGTLFEDMYWIDLDSETVIASETDSNHELQIVYSKNTKSTISHYDNILTIHSHPNSHPPSIEDFNSNYKNEYTLGIVICHDGSIYAYKSNQPVQEKYFSAVVAKYIQIGYNEREAQLEALKDVQRNFDISFQEVAAL